MSSSQQQNHKRYQQVAQNLNLPDLSPNIDVSPLLNSFLELEALEIAGDKLFDSHVRVPQRDLIYREILSSRSSGYFTSEETKKTSKKFRQERMQIFKRANDVKKEILQQLNDAINKEVRAEKAKLKEANEKKSDAEKNANTAVVEVLRKEIQTINNKIATLEKEREEKEKQFEEALKEFIDDKIHAGLTNNTIRLVQENELSVEEARDKEGQGNNKNQEEKITQVKLFRLLGSRSLSLSKKTTVDPQTGKSSVEYQVAAFVLQGNKRNFLSRRVRTNAAEREALYEGLQNDLLDDGEEEYNFDPDAFPSTQGFCSQMAEFQSASLKRIKRQEKHADNGEFFDSRVVAIDDNIDYLENLPNATYSLKRAAEHLIFTRDEIERAHSKLLRKEKHEERVNTKSSNADHRIEDRINLILAARGTILNTLKNVKVRNISEVAKAIHDLEYVKTQAQAAQDKALVSIASIENQLKAGGIKNPSELRKQELALEIAKKELENTGVALEKLDQVLKSFKTNFDQDAFADTLTPTEMAAIVVGDSHLKNKIATALTLDPSDRGKLDNQKEAEKIFRSLSSADQKKVKNEIKHERERILNAAFNKENVKSTLESFAVVVKGHNPTLEALAKILADIDEAKHNGSGAFDRDAALHKAEYRLSVSDYSGIKEAVNDAYAFNPMATIAALTTAQTVLKDPAADPALRAKVILTRSLDEINSVVKANTTAAAEALVDNQSSTAIATMVSHNDMRDQVAASIVADESNVKIMVNHDDTRDRVAASIIADESNVKIMVSRDDTRDQVAANILTKKSDTNTMIKHSQGTRDSVANKIGIDSGNTIAIITHSQKTRDSVANEIAANSANTTAIITHSQKTRNSVANEIAANSANTTAIITHSQKTRDSIASEIAVNSEYTKKMITHNEDTLDFIARKLFDDPENMAVIMNNTFVQNFSVEKIVEDKGKVAAILQDDARRKKILERIEKNNGFDVISKLVHHNDETRDLVAEIIAEKGNEASAAALIKDDQDSIDEIMRILISKDVDILSDDETSPFLMIDDPLARARIKYQHDLAGAIAEAKSISPDAVTKIIAKRLYAKPSSFFLAAPAVRHASMSRMLKEEERHGAFHALDSKIKEQVFHSLLSEGGASLFEVFKVEDRNLMFRELLTQEEGLNAFNALENGFKIPILNALLSDVAGQTAFNAFPDSDKVRMLSALLSDADGQAAFNAFPGAVKAPMLSALLRDADGQAAFNKLAHSVKISMLSTLLSAAAGQEAFYNLDHAFQKQALSDLLNTTAGQTAFNALEDAVKLSILMGLLNTNEGQTAFNGLDLEFKKKVLSDLLETEQGQIAFNALDDKAKKSILDSLLRTEEGLRVFNSFADDIKLATMTEVVKTAPTSPEVRTALADIFEGMNPEVIAANMAIDTIILDDSANNTLAVPDDIRESLVKNPATTIKALNITYANLSAAYAEIINPKATPEEIAQWIEDNPTFKKAVGITGQGLVDNLKDSKKKNVIMREIGQALKLSNPRSVIALIDSHPVAKTILNANANHCAASMSQASHDIPESNAVIDLETATENFESSAVNINVSAIMDIRKEMINRLADAIIAGTTAAVIMGNLDPAIAAEIKKLVASPNPHQKLLVSKALEKASNLVAVFTGAKLQGLPADNFAKLDQHPSVMVESKHPDGSAKSDMEMIKVRENVLNRANHKARQDSLLTYFKNPQDQQGVLTGVPAGSSEPLQSVTLKPLAASEGAPIDFSAEEALEALAQALKDYSEYFSLIKNAREKLLENADKGISQTGRNLSKRSKAAARLEETLKTLQETRYLYHLEPLPSGPHAVLEAGALYVDIKDGVIVYVVSAEGKRFEGKITASELHKPIPATVAELEVLLGDILQVTTGRGHTQEIEQEKIGQATHLLNMLETNADISRLLDEKMVTTATKEAEKIKKEVTTGEERLTANCKMVKENIINARSIAYNRLEADASNDGIKNLVDLFGGQNRGVIQEVMSTVLGQEALAAIIAQNDSVCGLIAKFIVEDEAKSREMISEIPEIANCDQPSKVIDLLKKSPLTDVVRLISTHKDWFAEKIAESKGLCVMLAKERSIVSAHPDVEKKLTDSKEVSEATPHVKVVNEAREKARARILNVKPPKAVLEARLVAANADPNGVALMDKDPAYFDNSSEVEKAIKESITLEMLDAADEVTKAWDRIIEEAPSISSATARLEIAKARLKPAEARVEKLEQQQNDARKHIVEVKSVTEELDNTHNLGDHLKKVSLLVKRQEECPKPFLQRMLGIR